MANDLAGDHVTDLRTRTDEKLASAIRDAIVAHTGGDVTHADQCVAPVFVAREVVAAREQKHAQRATQAQRAILRKRADPPAPSSLPQSAPPPPHMGKADPKRAKEAEQIALLGRARAGRTHTEVVYLPEWTRRLARSIALDRGAATRELGHLPKHVADSLRASAGRYGGGLDSAAGRNLVAIGVVFFWMGRALNGRISGLSRAAWASLTVGWKGKHYGSSTLFHPYHRADPDELDPDRRGPYGGRIGTGNNCGLVCALGTDGWFTVFVPDARACPEWMVSNAGWAFVQVLVREHDPGDTS